MNAHDRRYIALVNAFRNADAMDWDRLFEMLPDSGYGKFWKAVMREAKEALEQDTWPCPTPSTTSKPT